MLSEKIRDLRRRSGLSQEELAEKLDVSRQAVSKWETGAAVPNPEKLVELSDCFGVTLDFLMREKAGEGIGESGASDSRESTRDIPGKSERFSRKKRKAVGGFLLGVSAGAVLLIAVVFALGVRDVFNTSSTVNISMNGTGAAVIFAAVCAVAGIILLISSRK
ncbi:MAG: helix-turn-helix domain-containing protein [Oscillospiraceae bacterium]|nr:helix-turn-helix domain-containing protein [Oscillospiraceae bacterium]